MNKFCAEILNWILLRKGHTHTQTHLPTFANLVVWDEGCILSLTQFQVYFNPAIILLLLFRLHLKKYYNWTSNETNGTSYFNETIYRLCKMNDQRVESSFYSCCCLNDVRSFKWCEIVSVLFLFLFFIAFTVECAPNWKQNNQKRSNVFVATFSIWSVAW